MEKDRGGAHGEVMAGRQERLKDFVREVGKAGRWSA